MKIINEYNGNSLGSATGRQEGSLLVSIPLFRFLYIMETLLNTNFKLK